MATYDGRYEGPTSGAPAPVSHYLKRAWRVESAAYVTWESTDPLEPYPDGGTLDPPLGVVVYEWT